ncbi:unnamed protein product [Mycena citricolor]|uniref:Uncharacterized protein n=1 Tax=Mycena citricolor TaxID=2018698 RepID=A0AAD2Q3M5_9AGAR|nr:unnamed protein product [Mycena citricolor]CAK5284016.1 unnamed protein product [Mycena citricolor]
MAVTYHYSPPQLEARGEHQWALPSWPWPVLSLLRRRLVRLAMLKSLTAAGLQCSSSGRRASSNRRKPRRDDLADDCPGRRRAFVFFEVDGVCLQVDPSLFLLLPCQPMQDDVESGEPRRRRRRTIPVPPCESAEGFYSFLEDLEAFPKELSLLSSAPCEAAGEAVPEILSRLLNILETTTRLLRHASPCTRSRASRRDHDCHCGYEHLFETLHGRAVGSLRQFILSRYLWDISADAREASRLKRVVAGVDELRRSGVVDPGREDLRTLLQRRVRWGLRRGRSC